MVAAKPARTFGPDNVWTRAIEVSEFFGNTVITTPRTSPWVTGVRPKTSTISVGAALWLRRATPLQRLAGAAWYTLMHIRTAIIRGATLRIGKVARIHSPTDLRLVLLYVELAAKGEDCACRKQTGNEET